MKGLGIEAIGDAGKVTQAELQKFSADVFKQASKADALLVSCGGLRTLEILAPLEKETRVPVVSSLPHSLWAGMRLLGPQRQSTGLRSPAGEWLGQEAGPYDHHHETICIDLSGRRLLTGDRRRCHRAAASRPSASSR